MAPYTPRKYPCQVSFAVRTQAGSVMCSGCPISLQGKNFVYDKQLHVCSPSKAFLIYISTKKEEGLFILPLLI